MNYTVKENLLNKIQNTLFCTVCHALILYDIAWRMHEYYCISIENAVDSVIKLNDSQSF